MAKRVTGRGSWVTRHLIRDIRGRKRITRYWIRDIRGRKRDIRGRKRITRYWIRDTRGRKRDTRPTFKTHKKACVQNVHTPIISFSCYHYKSLSYSLVHHYYSHYSLNNYHLMDFHSVLSFRLRRYP